MYFKNKNIQALQVGGIEIDFIFFLRELEDKFTKERDQLKSELQVRRGMGYDAANVLCLRDNVRKE